VRRGFGSPRVRAFTLIEMMIVVLVAVMLITMSIGFINSLRLLAVQRAASDVMVAASTARQLAMQEDDTALYYGVEVVDQPGGGGAYVAVIQGNGTSAPTILLSDEDRDGDGEMDPVLKLPISNSVIVWRGEQDLRQVQNSQAHLSLAPHRDHTVAWFYRGATGKVHARDSSDPTGLTDYTFSVGLKPETLDWVYGKDYGGAPVPDLAPGETDATDGTYHPGLSLRSPDDRYRYAIAIYPSGVGFSADFSAETEGE